MSEELNVFEWIAENFPVNKEFKRRLRQWMHPIWFPLATPQWKRDRIRKRVEK
jgi:hypothetical protein